MNPTINQVVLNLLEATVTLYPANADGTPALDAPLWTGAAAERLTARATWLKEETRPSGTAYPRRHPLVPQIQIEIGRVWLLDSVLAPTGFAADYTNYVLDVTWVEDSPDRSWHRKTFYGVTIADQEWSARDIESGLLEEQRFEAQYFTVASGTLAPDPVAPWLAPAVPKLIRATLPAYVVYTAGGVVTVLYTYADGVFTSVAATTGRATITNSPFAVQFSGDSSPVVAASADASLAYRSGAAYRNASCYRQNALAIRAGLASGAGIFAAVALPGDSPRLDFFNGVTRVFTVTRAGLFETDFVEGPPVFAIGSFQLFGGGGALVAVAERGRITATQFQVTN